MATSKDGARTAAAHKELIVLLIGPCGSGKSSFVKSLTREKVEVCQALGLGPCTTECKIYKVRLSIGGYSNWTFNLIDTPGFVDLPDHNLEILENIAETLKGLGQKRVFGCVYFHDISEMRMKGTTLKILDIFKALCGEKFYPHVAFVTTKWNRIKSRHYTQLDDIHKELKNGHMSLNGASTHFKSMNDDDVCPKAVLEHFTLLWRKRPIPPQLRLMNEFQKETKRVGNTAAGRRILKDSRAGPSACCIVM